MSDILNGEKVITQRRLEYFKNKIESIIPKNYFISNNGTTENTSSSLITLQAVNADNESEVIYFDIELEDRTDKWNPARLDVTFSKRNNNGAIEPFRNFIFLPIDDYPEISEATIDSWFTTE